MTMSRPDPDHAGTARALTVDEPDTPTVDPAAIDWRRPPVTWTGDLYPEHARLIDMTGV